MCRTCVCIVVCSVVQGVVNKAFEDEDDYDLDEEHLLTEEDRQDREVNSYITRIKVDVGQHTCISRL